MAGQMMIAAREMLVRARSRGEGDWRSGRVAMLFTIVCCEEECGYEWTKET